MKNTDSTSLRPPGEVPLEKPHPNKKEFSVDAITSWFEANKEEITAANIKALCSSAGEVPQANWYKEGPFPTKPVDVEYYLNRKGHYWFRWMEDDQLHTFRIKTPELVNIMKSKKYGDQLTFTFKLNL